LFGPRDTVERQNFERQLKTQSKSLQSATKLLFNLETDTQTQGQSLCQR